MKSEFWHRYNTQMSSDIKIASLKTLKEIFASLWSALTTATSSRWLKCTRRKEPSSLKNKFGIILFKSSEVWKLYTISESATEISNVLTYLWPKVVWSRWVTSTSLKLPRKVWCIPRQELHTMPVLRFGKISHMITEATFGPSVAFFMKW